MNTERYNLIVRKIGVAVATVCFFTSFIVSAADESLLTDAKKYVDKKEFNSAIIQLKNILQKDPNQKDARLLLGQVYVKIGNPEGAEKELERAQSLGAAESDVIPYLAQAKLASGKTDEVLKSYKPNPAWPKFQNALLYAVLGDANLVKTNKDEARVNYEKAIELDAAYSDAYLGVARIDTLENKLDAALIVLDKAIKIDNNINAWILKGELKFKQNKVSEARDSFMAATKIDKNFIPALLALANLSIAEKKNDEALKYINAVKAVRPDHPIATYLFALTKYQSKDYAAADDALLQILKTYPNYFQAQLLMGNVQYQKGNYEQAQNYFNHFYQKNSEFLPAIKMLASSQLKTNSVKKALDLLEKHKNKAQDDYQYLALLGTAYMRSGNAAKGTEYLEKAAALEPEAPELKTQLALSYLAGGEIEDAITALESASTLNKEFTQADVLLITTLLRKGDYKDALKAAQSLVKKEPNSPVPLNFEGVSYIGMKDFANAKKSFEKAIKIDSKFIPAYMNLARIAEQENNLDAAKNYYSDALRIDEKHEGVLIGLARVAAIQKDRLAMEKYLKQAYDSHPKSVVSAVAYARSFIESNEPGRALDILKPVIGENPNHPSILEAQGLAYLSKQDFTNAVSIFENLSKRYPKAARARVLLGQAYLANKQTSKAKDALNDAIRVNPNDISAYVMLAQTEMMQKNYRGVSDIAATLQKKFEKIATGWLLEGDVYIEQKSFAKALSAYRVAFDKEKNPQTLVKYAQAEILNKSQDKGLKLFSDWLGHDSSNVFVRTNYAIELQNINRFDEAAVEYETILKVDPNNVAVLNNLAWIYTEKKDKRAITYAEKAFQLAQSSPAVIDTLGWAYVKSGNVKKGITLLQDAVLKAPNILSIRFHFAYALNETGKKAEAKKELGRLLAEKDDFPERQQAKELLASLK